MNEPTPALLILVVPLRSSAPSERLRLAVFAPLLFNTVRVDVDACVRSSVVDPPEKGTLVSAIVMSLKVFAPVNVWVVERSARVMLPAAMVAVVPPDPGTNVRLL